MINIRSCIKYISFLFITCILLYILNMISFALPNNLIRKHISESSDLMPYANNYPPMVLDSNNYKEYRLLGLYTFDYYTDSLILLVSYDALEPYKKLWERSIGSYMCSDETPVLCFHDILDNNKIPDMDYSRYWFGSSSALRFFLLFFNMFEIRYLYTIIIFSLLLYMLYLISKELSFQYSLIYLFAFISMGIIMIPFSVYYSANMFIILISSILILRFYKNDKYNKYIYYFFTLIGILTAYYDLLSFPLCTFSFPFITYFLLKLSKEEKNKEYYLSILKLSLSWLIGYIFTSLFIIMLSSIVIGTSVWNTAWDRIFYRMSTKDKKQDYRLYVLEVLLPMTFNKMNLLIIGIYYIASIYKIVKNKYYKKVDYHNIITILFIMTIPIIWYLIFFEHSIRHRFFTYRNNIIILLCLLIIPLLFYTEKKKERGKKKNGI